MSEPAALLAIITAVFLLAGAVKGVVGLGLPIVSLGLLSVLLELPTAMALMLVPALITNIWQALVGAGLVPLLRRLWPFLLAAALGVWPGALALTRVDSKLLLAMLGALLVVYAAVGLFGLRFVVPPRREAWAGPLCGASNGLFAGMTGCLSVPGVMYLQALGLARDQLVQAMGMLFTVSTLALGIAMQSERLLSLELGLISTAAVLPALLGMQLGRALRQRLSEALFSRVLLVAILLVGLGLVAKAALLSA